MIFKYDTFDAKEKIKIKLCDYDRSSMNYIPFYNLECRYRWAEISEVEFTIPKYVTGVDGTSVENSYYNSIKELRYIFINNAGYFRIMSTKIYQEGKKKEYKTVLTKSAENDMNFKYVEDFIINTGTTGSHKDVVFYNKNDPNRSLLHLALEKMPEWTIKYVSPNLKNIKLSFDIDRMSIYAFLTQELYKSIKCVFEFDVARLMIYVYTIDEVGQDTNIYISKEKLTKSIEVNYVGDEIKTKLYCAGAEDTNFRDINLGSNAIINLDYYMQGTFLETKWNKYKQKVKGYAKGYKEYYDSLQIRLGQIEQRKSAAIDVDINTLLSSDDKYLTLTKSVTIGQYYLEEQLKTYTNLRSVAEENGWNQPEHQHNADYNKYIKIIADINAALSYVNEIINHTNGTVLQTAYFGDRGADEVEYEIGLSIDSLPEKYDANANPYILAYNLTLIGFQWLKKRKKFWSNPKLDIDDDLNIDRIILYIDKAIEHAQTDIEEKLVKYFNSVAYYRVQMDSWAEDCLLENNFTEKELNYINSLIIEDEMTDDSYLVTKGMDVAESNEVKLKLKQRCEEELQVISQPRISFEIDMVNLFRIPELKKIYSDFALGNYINVSLGDSNNLMKVRIHELNLKDENPNSFSVSFSNMIKLKRVSGINGELIGDLKAKIRRASKSQNKG